MIPEFGPRNSGREYVLRPGAYALILDSGGRIVVVETPEGCFLPGGGLDSGESAEAAVVREVMEECGLEIELTGSLGTADQLLERAGEERGLRKRCAFFRARVEGASRSPSEPDHALLWVTMEEGDRRLTHECHSWAVRRLCEGA